MLETATVSFDISDHLGNDFDPRRTKVWVTTNVPGNTIVDTEGDQIRLGSGTTTVAADGTGSLSVWVPDESANPASWQTSIHVDYPDRAANSGRTQKSFGPFTIGPNVKVTNKALTSNVATLTTGTAHGLLAGDKVTVLDVAAPFAGTWTVATAPTTTTFTFAVTNANITSVATTGRLATSLADLVDEMPVQPEYLATVLDTVQEMIDEATDGTAPALAALASRVDGYVDHGEVSGAVTLNGPTGSHWFDATAATTVTLDDFAEGQVVTLICFAGAEDVTLADFEDAEMVDGTAFSAQLARGVWVSGGGGGTPAVPDTTPPSSITGLSATGGEGQLTFNYSASTDTESTVSYRWRVWPTAGGATGAYTTRSTVGPITVTGLSAGGYTVQVYAYSNGGSSAVASATATVTAVPGWSSLVSDTFTGSDGTLAGHVPDTTPDSAAWATGSSPDFVAIASNKITHNATGYNPAATLLIPTQTVGIGVALDVVLVTQPDTSTPALGISLKSPDNGDDLNLTIFMAAGALSIELTQGNGLGNVTLTGTTTGLPLTGRYGMRWRLSDKSVSITHNGAQIATGTTSNPSYSRDFKQVRLSMTGYKSSTVDNFVIESYT